MPNLTSIKKKNLFCFISFLFCSIFLHSDLLRDNDLYAPTTWRSPATSSDHLSFIHQVSPRTVFSTHGRLSFSPSVPALIAGLPWLTSTGTVVSSYSSIDFRKWFTASPLKWCCYCFRPPIPGIWSCWRSRNCFHQRTHGSSICPSPSILPSPHCLAIQVTVPPSGSR